MSSNVEIYKDKLYFKNVEYDYDEIKLLLSRINKKIVKRKLKSKGIFPMSLVERM